MANHQWPTKIGDVLILRTSRSYTVYAVGSVVTAGQHDFGHSEQVRHVITHAEAVISREPLSPLADGSIFWTSTQRSGHRFQTDPLPLRAFPLLSLQMIEAAGLTPDTCVLDVRGDLATGANPHGRGP